MILLRFVNLDFDFYSGLVPIKVTGWSQSINEVAKMAPILFRSVPLNTLLMRSSHPVTSKLNTWDMMVTTGTICYT